MLLNIPLNSIDFGDRQRKDYGDVASLALSIGHIGLLQPITVVENINGDFRYMLVAGGRRLTAFTLLAKQEDKFKTIPAIVSDELKGVEITAELVENLYRKEMHWKEYCMGVLKLCKAKEFLALKDGKSFTMEMLGKMLGSEAQSVRAVTLVGKALEVNDAEISACSTMSEAYQVLVRRRSQELAAGSLAKNSRKMTKTNVLLRQSAEAVQVKPLDESKPFTYDNVILRRADITKHKSAHAAFGPAYIFTDIPYGIDMKNLNVADIVSKTHDVEDNVALFPVIFSRAFELLPEKGALIMFADLVHFEKLIAFAEQAGFRAQKWPIICVKTSGSSNAAVHFNFTKNYECVMVFMKTGTRLHKPSSVSVFNFAWGRGEREQYLHEFSKPSALVKQISEHIIPPNSRVLDFFCGEGSICKALAEQGHTVMGTDIEQTHINRALTLMPGSIHWERIATQ